MNLWERIKQWFRTFMTGRHGIDQLSMMLVWAGLALYLVDVFLGSGILTLLSLACYVYSLFRAFSRNRDKRLEENRRYTQWLYGIKRSWSQARARFANRKEYKYFRCPQCRTWIRIPRGAGDVNVTCRNCGNRFGQKA